MLPAVLLPLVLALPCLLMGCPPAETTRTTETDAAAGDGGGSLRRIVILTNGDDPYWDACQAGAEAAASDLDLASKGYKLAFERASFSAESQIDLLRQYQAAGDVAGLGICVVDAESQRLAEEMAALQRQGASVITIDNDLNAEKYRDNRTVYLGTDNFLGGQELGRAAAAIRPEGGKYVALVGIESATNSRERTDGFADGAGEAFEEVERQADGGKEDIARDRVRSTLENHDDLAALVGIYAYNTPAAMQIAGQMDRDLMIASFDADERSIAGMADGKVDVMVVQNPFAMGYEGVELLLAMATGEDAIVAERFPNLGQDGGDIRNTGLKVVVPEGSPVTPDILDPSTELLTLPEFQAWLKKYGLRSS